MIRAIIFDFDGLILDTEGPDYQAWLEIFGEHSCTLPLSAWAHCIGARSGVFDPAAYLEEQLGRPVDRDALRARHRERFIGLVEEESVLPGVAQYIDDARRLKLKRAAASSSRRDWVEKNLARLGLLPLFDCIKCFGDVEEAKPAPDLYEAVLDELALGAHQAIAFEDSPNGITAAHAAGLFCVAIPNRVTRQLDLGTADLIAGSLADLPLEKLLAQVQQTGRG